MKSFRKELWFNIPNRRGFVNITPEVESALRESGIREGLVLVNRESVTIPNSVTFGSVRISPVICPARELIINRPLLTSTLTFNISRLRRFV